ncbi:hypothetical protein P7K49_040293, partial [Saguinus oedipus]
ATQKALWAGEYFAFKEAGKKLGVLAAVSAPNLRRRERRERRERRAELCQRELGSADSRADHEAQIPPQPVPARFKQPPSPSQDVHPV